jgi:peptide-methionine (S)-S-oxide reductase
MRDDEYISSMNPAILALLVATSPSSKASLDTAVFAGGCFWGVEAVFEHVKGVRDVVSGYAGGKSASPSYEQVGNGDTGHAESVQIVYDPAVVSYATLMRVFFSVAHDATQLNRQGPDVGTQYRSAIFFRNESQKKETEAYIAQLTRAKYYPDPIVTEVAPLTRFHPAEEYHQDYMMRHPNDPYIVYHDRPKLENLKRGFPELYSPKK